MVILSHNAADTYIRQKLREVGVPQGADDNSLFRLLLAATLEAACHHQHSLQRAHAKVIVRLT